MASFTLLLLLGTVGATSGKKNATDLAQTQTLNIVQHRLSQNSTSLVEFSMDNIVATGVSGFFMKRSRTSLFYLLLARVPKKAWMKKYPPHKRIVNCCIHKWVVNCHHL